MGAQTSACALQAGDSATTQETPRKKRRGQDGSGYQLKRLRITAGLGSARLPSCA